MSYIQPNSRIEFFDDIGISQDYNDTLYFPTLAAKDTYFSNINRLAHVDRCYYARENRGYVRVELPMNTMIHAQYMRFRNTSYENKWWYAFVTDVIYVNDNTTEVQFELDPMMTWMGEFNISPCFVERQHSETDEIGDNLVEENLNLGDYITEGYEVSGHFQNKKIMMITALHPTSEQAPFPWEEGGYYGGIYSGLSIGTTNSPAAANRVIEIMTQMNRTDELIFIQMVPSDFVCAWGSTEPKSYDVSASKPYTTIDNYTPRNNKLFTYPYKCLSVFNCEGDSVDLKYEYFSTENCGFNLKGMMGLDSVISCIPKNYMNEPLSHTNTINMRNFPKCSWTSDTYKAYIAQLQSSVPTNLLASSIPALPAFAQVAGLTMAGYSFANESMALTRMGSVMGGIGAVGGINKLIASQLIPPMMPNQVHGNQSSDNLYASNQKEFYFYKKSIRGETAKIIDDYFTMFGYADRTVHVPNMNARQRFTFIKTQACKINCRCPASDADFIENLFNRGIRFWKNHTQIGNYTDDNLPIA